MSDRELREFLEAIERFNAERPFTPEVSRALLIEEGVLTPSGELAEPYR
ncbi:MAG: hypothetical protein ABSD20_10555 [Terriglobales bacterium]|jgi:hypothetical protein